MDLVAMYICTYGMIVCWKYVSTNWPVYLLLLYLCSACSHLWMYESVCANESRISNKCHRLVTRYDLVLAAISGYMCVYVRACVEKMIIDWDCVLHVNDCMLACVWWVSEYVILVRVVNVCNNTWLCLSVMSGSMSEKKYVTEWWYECWYSSYAVNN